MSLFEVAAILLSLSAVFAYLNARYIGVPTTIGIMAIALIFSLALLLLRSLGYGELAHWAQALTASVDFDATLLQGMLSFLLFAGALHVNLGALLEQKWVIGLLATAGVLFSTFLIGTGLYYLVQLIEVELSYTYCLLFGAIISPTDPIAVLAILKSLGAPKGLSTKIAGESLFNDGIAVVLFVVILGLATGEGETGTGAVALLFLEEVAGGVVLGLALGLAGYYLLKKLDNYQVEVLITLALVMGGYALAMRLHLSGPLAVVVAGLLLGNHGRRFAMSDKTEAHLDNFWELVDEVLNAVLFLLIGLELLVIPHDLGVLGAGLLVVPLVLLSRFLSVGLPVLLLRNFRRFTPRAVRALTWGGLRGGISVALALSLPPGEEREFILAVTYVVVVFSILVQGLTVSKVIKPRGATRV